MTPEQEHIFIEVAQLGMASGLTHPYEWLTNYLMHNFWDSVVERAEKERRVIEAFVAFMQGTGSCPGDPVETMTAATLYEHIDAWYAHRREEHHG